MYNGLRNLSPLYHGDSATIASPHTKAADRLPRSKLEFCCRLPVHLGVLSLEPDVKEGMMKPETEGIS